MHSRRRTVSDGGGNASAPAESEEEKKKREAAEKARKDAEEAEKKATEAKQAADAKQKAADDAKKKAQDAGSQAQAVWNDPNATDAAKRTATQDALTAANDAAAAQAAADTAAKTAADAATDAESKSTTAGEAAHDYYDAMVDEEYGKAVEDALDDMGNPAFWGIDDFVKGVSGFAGAWWGTYGPGGSHDCVDGMACGMTCEQQARVKALIAELHRYSVPSCNTRATPVPDDVDQCYGSLTDAPQFTLADALKWMCEEQKKIGREVCAGQMPKFNKTFDPCSGPLVMCAPDALRPGSRASVALPSASLGFALPGDGPLLSPQPRNPVARQLP